MLLMLNYTKVIFYLKIYLSYKSGELVLDEVNLNIESIKHCDCY